MPEFAVFLERLLPARLALVWYLATIWFMLYNTVALKLSAPIKILGLRVCNGLPWAKTWHRHFAGFASFWEGENIKKPTHGFLQPLAVSFSIMMRRYFHTTLP